MTFSNGLSAMLKLNNEIVHTDAWKEVPEQFARTFLAFAITI